MTTLAGPADTTAPTTDAAPDPVLDAVVAALEEVLERPVTGVSAETSLFQEIGLDSTGVLDLLMVLEESLDLELDMENLEMKDFATVGTLRDFLTDQRAG
ncbi:acyl carrier protein [Cellulomonas sp. 179-A 4D5 NHS]|uniref:acyl carrier protein n=1 Tax=Cellulomonas sp. 179-A 4D5 NHS TaxID=3142378 RepID=UPI0039A22A5B